MRYPDNVPLAPQQTDRQPGGPIGKPDQPSALTGVSTQELMQTERGRELIDQLRVLLVSESTMGEKHPLYSEIQREIKETRGLLRNLALSRQIADEIEEESKEVKRYASALPAMQDKDLRRLILRLIIRVDDLEKEVQGLRDQQDQDAGRTPSSGKVGRTNSSLKQRRGRDVQTLPEPVGKPSIEPTKEDSLFEENPFFDD
jgi:hypothetical protein